MFSRHLCPFNKTIIKNVNNNLLHTKYSNSILKKYGHLSTESSTSILKNMDPFEGDPMSRVKYSQFMSVFPKIVKDLTDYTSKYDKTKMVTKHLEKALQYNVPNGKKIRGLTAVNVFEKLTGEESLTPEIVRMGHILGWCMEILQSLSLILDDILDKSVTRRNKLCWYKLDNVQSVAVNDSMMLLSGVHFLINKYFHHLPQYVDIIEFLNESAMITCIGESLDILLSRRDVSQFTMDTFKYMTLYKTSYFSFYTPIAIPMLLAGYKDQKTFETIKTICDEFGHFFQIRNDYHDLFSGDEMLSKPGTDIEEGKCSWLAVTTMERGNEQQKQILRECYGKNDSKSTELVRQVYKDMNFIQLYHQYKENAGNDTLKLIADIENNVLRDIMFGMMKDSYEILSATKTGFH